MHQILILFALFINFSVLPGCSNDPMEEDVKDFVADLKKRQPKGITPLPSLLEYEPIMYNAARLKDPFQPPGSGATRQPDPAMANVPKKNRPDIGRKQEYLESFPLDSLSMVGTLRKDGDMWALIIDKDGLLHRVQKGNYLGQNAGRIEKIADDMVFLKELIVDENGLWVHRSASLAIDR